MRPHLLALVLAVVVTVGCSVRGSGYEYVRSRATGTYLRVPEGWHVSELRDTDLRDELTEFGRVIDGKRAEDTPVYTGDRPGGFIRVQAINELERDVVSLEWLRNSVFPIDQASTQDRIEVLEYERLDQGGFRGHRLVFEADSTVGPVRIAQAALVDSSSTRAHVLVLGCSSRCFEEHRSEIDSVLESLTLKET